MEHITIAALEEQLKVQNEELATLQAQVETNTEIIQELKEKLAARPMGSTRQPISQRSNPMKEAVDQLPKLVATDGKAHCPTCNTTVRVNQWMRCVPCTLTSVREISTRGYQAQGRLPMEDAPEPEAVVA